MLLPNYIRYLKKIKKVSRRNKRIRFLAPVSMEDIVSVLNAYDIGLFLLPPQSFNYYLSLPNKLFEFIQGRLCIAIWPSKEMARVVKKYGCGVISDDFTVSSMARELNSLSGRQVYSYKQKSHEAAKVLTAEANRDVFIRIIERLFAEKIDGADMKRR